MIEFSIIIPHYNIPDLLMRCLQSIPVREDIQVIVVDDCSKDADQYVQRYPALSRPYLEFYSTSKGGSAGRARNVGLDHAEGKWLLFADADDFFVENLGEILDSNKDSTADVIFFRKLSVMSDDITKAATRSGWSDQIIDNYFRTRNDLEIRRSYAAPWGKMIRRKLVVDNDIRFDETRYSNDFYFSAFVGCVAGEIAVMDYPIYVVTVREGSLASGVLDKPNELKERSDVAFRVQELLQRHGYPVDLELLASYSYRIYKTEESLVGAYLDRVSTLKISSWMIFKEILHLLKERQSPRKMLWMGAGLKKRSIQRCLGIH